ncbi:MAG: DUF4116 domain-containing protein [Candidatus Yonathbacteria bacterium]|nr:DUF4116 domain-containing protein [Candidatus Yonathbacteria bacterium]
MTPEKFDPHDPQYKKVEDLPQEQQKNFVDIDGGFVGKEAKETLTDAKALAEITSVLKNTGLTGKDILHKRVLKEAYEKMNYEEEKKLILEVVMKYGGALEYAKEFQSDKEVVLAAVKRCGGALYYASEELQNNKDVVLEAVNNNSNALLFASDELRNDKEVVLAAIKHDHNTLVYASEEIEELLGLEEEKDWNEFLDSIDR